MIRTKLDKEFLPMICELKRFERDVSALPPERRARISLSVERNGGYREVYTYEGMADGVDDARNCAIAERLAKTLLWICGGFRIGVSGSRTVCEHLSRAYCEGGARAFDAAFMSGVYERSFGVVSLAAPPAIERASVKVGGYRKGCRIGFDAGGSDRKVSAVVDGIPVYSEEVVWNPKIMTDPDYHYRGILKAMRTAASKMPRVDSIGVSSAGVYIDNKIMVASLFLAVDKKKYGDRIKNMYLDVAKEIGAPVVVCNDGDVTALAGSMELRDTRVLGIAMGTSEAAGYINAEGGINGWLSELAFAPVDFSARRKGRMERRHRGRLQVFFTGRRCQARGVGRIYICEGTYAGADAQGDSVPCRAGRRARLRYLPRHRNLSRVYRSVLCAFLRNRAHSSARPRDERAGWRNHSLRMHGDACAVSRMRGDRNRDAGRKEQTGGTEHRGGISSARQGVNRCE